MLYLWGAIPLLLGLGSFALWFFTRGMGFALIGLAVIMLGFLATIGFAVHLAFALRRRRAGRGGKRLSAKTALLATLLMLANYPAAAGCVAVYDFLATRAYLRISNRSGAAIDELTVSGPGGRRALGSLAAGRTRRAFFLPEGYGGLSLVVEQEGERVEHALAYYLVTEAGRAAWTVDIRPGPAVESRAIFREID